MNAYRPTNSCLDGVPFTLHESFKTIEQIQLSLPLRTIPLNGILDASAFIYESSVEERFLVKQETERRRESEISELNRQFQLFVEVQKNKLKISNDGAAPLPESLHRAPLSNVSEESSRPSPGLVFRAGTAGVASLGNEILVPCRLDPKERKAIEEKILENKIDLKDFENEQDPFENVSLKVINDIEELDKVFLASSHVAPTSAKNSNDHSTLSVSFYPSAPAVSSAAATTSESIREQPQPFTNWQNYSSAQQRTVATYAPHNPPYSSHRMADFRHGRMDAGSPFCPEADVGKLGFDQPIETATRQNYTAHRSLLTNNFYFNKHHASQINDTRASPPVLPTTETSNLRHAKSTSDIAALDDFAENPTAVCVADEKTPNYLQNLNVRGRYTPPLRAGKSTAGEMVHASSRSHLQQQTANDIMLTEKFAAMGMKRDLIKRVISRHSPNDDKVVACLHRIKDFITKGHDLTTTEECILYFDDLPSQLESYLNGFETYRAMGFQAAKIHAALGMAGSNGELALNILTRY